MKYWIYRDGLQRGPFTIEELADMNLTPDTPVWYEGLDNWITAAEAPGLAPFLTTRNDGADNRPVDVEYTEADSSAGAAFSSNQFGPQQTQEPLRSHACEQSRPQSECPPTYLAWSIIVTICCCLPLGIAAIIYSGKVKPCWQQGDERGAYKASETAQLLIILSVTISLLISPLAILF